LVHVVSLILSVFAVFVGTSLYIFF